MTYINRPVEQMRKQYNSLKKRSSYLKQHPPHVNVGESECVKAQMKFLEKYLTSAKKASASPVGKKTPPAKKKTPPAKKKNVSPGEKLQLRFEKVMNMEQKRWKDFNAKAKTQRPATTRKQIIQRIKRIALGEGFDSEVKFYFMKDLLSDPELRIGGWSRYLVDIADAMEDILETSTVSHRVKHRNMTETLYRLNKNKVDLFVEKVNQPNTDWWKIVNQEEDRFKKFVKKKPTRAQIIARIKKIAAGKGDKSAVKFYVMKSGLYNMSSPNMNAIANAMENMEANSGWFDPREGEMRGGKFNIRQSYIDEFTEKFRVKRTARAPKKKTTPVKKATPVSKKNGNGKNALKNSNWNNTVWANQLKRNNQGFAAFKDWNTYINTSSENAFEKNTKAAKRAYPNGVNLYSNELWGLDMIYPPVSFKHKNGRWKTIKELSKERNEKFVGNNARLQLVQRQANARMARMKKYLETLPPNHKIFKSNLQTAYNFMVKNAERNEDWFERFKKYVKNY